MKIHKIKLKNFRQFYGEHTIEFATGAERNVTLIHAENGFGKTTLLNAVLWALFNQLTKKFEDPDKILNFTAEDEGEHLASVEVEFEFNKTNYLVSRYFDKTKTNKDKTTLQAYKIESGAHKAMDAPFTFISSVVPAEMAKYFFFDGEAAEAFSSAKNYKEIRIAIRSILGCELADTAIEDLRDMSKQITKNIGQIAGESEIQKIETNLSKTLEEIERAKQIKKDIEDDIEIFRYQRNELAEKLTNMEESKNIQALRQEKKSRCIQVKTDIKEIHRNIIAWIGQEGIHVISQKISKETLNFIDEESIKGKIPSPYNEDFVKELLEKEVCICKRQLNPGTEEWKSVADLLRNAANAEILGRIVRARARISNFREKCVDAITSIEKQNKKLADKIQIQNRLEQEIAELGKKIEDLPISEISEMERARRKLDKKIQEENQKIGGIRVKINELENIASRLEDALIKASEKNKKAGKLVKRRNLVSKSLELLTSMLEAYEQKARETLQKEINGILDEVAHKDFKCHLNSNFAIELRLADERPSPKSGGENQLLSLVFIASLVKYSASRIDDEKRILKPGTIAPLVLDAPLGQLDTTYQGSTVKYVPTLAEQVVLLLSSGQGGEGVLEALEPYIGAEYLLISQNKASKGKKPEVKRILHGREHLCTLFDCPKNMTSIERI